MLTVAYISNVFPSPVEPYVLDEIRRLRRRGVRVIPCSVRRPSQVMNGPAEDVLEGTVCLRTLNRKVLWHAAWLCTLKLPVLADLLVRALRDGDEPFSRRLRALLHTWLGAYYALLLRGKNVEHIHVHHGYFAAWVAMVAARLLGITFSMTLHGSDLLLHRVFLDTKLAQCKFCITVSEFNRQHILLRYPQVAEEKIIVQRMGVDANIGRLPVSMPKPPDTPLILLSVGRLHLVKDHAFLLRACRELKDRRVRFLCVIAGEGPERQSLERSIGDLDLQAEVSLLGHLSRETLDSCYAMCDLVVLTSRSEGIPLVLMEAMGHGRPVLAPAITGIPELVVDGETGFLYQPGSIESFVANVAVIRRSPILLTKIRREAREHVLQHFNREKNLTLFADVFMERVAGVRSDRYEDPVLQQI